VVDVARARKLQKEGLGLRPIAKKLRVSVNTLAKSTQILGSPLLGMPRRQNLPRRISATRHVDRVQLGLTMTGSAVDFLFSPSQGSSTTATVKAGQKASYSMDLVDQGYSGSVTLSCSGTPPLATCSANPATATLNGNGTQTISVAVQTSAPTSATLHTGAGDSRITALLLVSLSLPGIALIAGGTRSRLRRVLASGLVVLCLLALMSCGGGSVTSTGGGGGSPGTPPGTYSLMISAASGGVNLQVGVTLVVQ
jgi:hypothetical protein